jgi:uncharacterized OB-fold protein
MRYTVKNNGIWDCNSREGEDTGPGLICSNCGEVVRMVYCGPEQLCEKCFKGDKTTALKAWIEEGLPAQYTR